MEMIPTALRSRCATDRALFGTLKIMAKKGRLSQKKMVRMTFAESYLHWKKKLTKLVQKEKQISQQMMELMQFPLVKADEP